MLGAAMVDLSSDIEVYAALSAALADPAADRAALLAAHGLDEDTWDALDDAWQARLSAAEEGEGEGVPPLVAAHAEAFARAQRARAGAPLSFERFVEIARAMQRGSELATLLGRLGVSLDDFLTAQRTWTEAMIGDEGLAERFRRAMR